MLKSTWIRLYVIITLRTILRTSRDSSNFLRDFTKFSRYRLPSVEQKEASNLQQLNFGFLIDSKRFVTTFHYFSFISKFSPSKHLFCKAPTFGIFLFYDSSKRSFRCLLSTLIYSDSDIMYAKWENLEANRPKMLNKAPANPPISAKKPEIVYTSLWWYTTSSESFTLTKNVYLFGNCLIRDTDMFGLSTVMNYSYYLASPIRKRLSYSSTMFRFRAMLPVCLVPEFTLNLTVFTLDFIGLAISDRST